MDKALADIIQEMDNLLKSQNRGIGVADGPGTSGTYTLNGKSIRIDISGGNVTLFEVLAPGTEFPYQTWQDQSQPAEIAKAAIGLLDGND